MEHKKSHVLSDAWAVEGANLKKFREICNMIQERTLYIPIGMQDISLLSYEGKAVDNDGNLIRDAKGRTITQWTVLSQKTLANFNRTGAFNEHVMLDNDAISKDLLDECIGSTRLLLMNRQEPKKVYIVSECAMNTIGQRLHYKSEYILRPSLSRDCDLMQHILYEMERDRCAVMVIRRDAEGNNKVFSLPSTDYVMYEQKNLADFMDHVFKETAYGEPVFAGWWISNLRTELCIEFPEYGQELQRQYSLPDLLVPGIVVRTSDIGDCSLSVISTLRPDDAEYPIILGNCTRKHTNGLENSTDFLDESYAKLLEDTALIPEALAEFIKVPIGENLDLTLEEGRMRNVDLVMEQVTRVARKAGLLALKTNTCVGQKRSAKILDDIREKVEEDTGRRYTQYDVRILLIHVPDMLDSMHVTRVRRIQKTCAACIDTSFHAGGTQGATA